MGTRAEYPGDNADALATGVGKSCLLLGLCGDPWAASFTSTISIDFKIRAIEIDCKRIKLHMVRSGNIVLWVESGPISEFVA
jgi:GTPase SAR1 family protein